jgi:NDP-sugar pyrophosphorylase family protein
VLPAEPLAQMTPTFTVIEGARHGSRRGVAADGERGRTTFAGIVLAGSYEAPDNAFSALLPRPLVPIAQTPLVTYALRWLSSAGPEHIAVCRNTHSRSAVSAIWPLWTSMRLSFVEDTTPRGPAGCVRDAALLSAASTIVVVEGSIIPTTDIDAVLDAHRHSNAALTVVVHQEANKATGSVGATPAGIYVFERRILGLISAVGYQDIKEHLIPALRNRQERVLAHVAQSVSPRVINAETYLAVNYWMLEQIPTRFSLLPWEPPTGNGGSIMAHPSAAIDPAATIVGPTLIGPGVTIGPGALIVGPSSIDAGSHIEAGAVVCRSVIWKGCTVGRQSFVDHAVIGDSGVIAPGQTVEREVKLPTRVRGERVKTPTRRSEGPVPSTSPARAIDLAVR